MKKILLSLLCAGACIFGTKADEATITYSQAYSTVTSGSQSLDGTNETVPNSPVKIAYAKASGNTAPAYYANGTAARIYTNNTVTFTVPEGYSLDKMVFTATSTKDKETLVGKTDVGTFTNSGVTSTWTAPTDEKVNKVVYTPSANGRIMSIVFTFSSAGPVKPVYSEFEEEYTITIGETMDLPEIYPTELTYTFEIAKGDNVIELDDKTKTIKGLAEGFAEVKFTTAALDDKFTAGEGSFLVTVDKIAPQMEFRDQVVYGKLGVGIVWEPVQVIMPEDPELRGDITYTSSNTSIVEIDATSGQIHPEGILKAGEVKITATMAAKGEYAEGSASYTVVIIDPNAEIKPSTAQFDFTQENAYGMTTQSGSTAIYETKIKEIVSTDGNVSISFTGNYRSFAVSGAYELRLQKNATMSIEVPEGYKISKIGLVATGDKGDKTAGTYNPAGDSVEGETGDNTGIETPNSSWIPKDDADAISKVTYSTGSEVTNISKIYVLYEAASSNLQGADLTFDEVINNAYMNENTTLNAVNNPHGLEISYSIENLDEDQYTITPSADGKTISVNIKVPGFYSLQATSPANDTYRDGFAIMRVNVYRHLDVFVNESTTPITTDVIDTKDATEITMNVPELANLYYQIVTEGTPAVAADSDDENQLPGFTLYDNDEGISIDKGTSGKLNFYIANYGYRSPIRTITLEDSTSTGISEVSGGVKANEVYDLMGRKVVRPANGLYIVNGVKVRL